MKQRREELIRRKMSNDGREPSLTGGILEDGQVASQHLFGLSLAGKTRDLTKRGMKEKENKNGTKRLVKEKEQILEE